MRRGARLHPPSSVRVRAGAPHAGPSIPISEFKVCRGLPRPAPMHRARERPLTLGSCAQCPPGSEQSISRTLHALTLGSRILNPGILMARCRGPSEPVGLKLRSQEKGPGAGALCSQLHSGSCFVGATLSASLAGPFNGGIFSFS